jgi:hypothetical protein
MTHERMNTAHGHGPLIAVLLVLAAGLLLLHVPLGHRDGAAIASTVLLLVGLAQLGLLALVRGPLSVLFPGLAARFRGQAGAVNHAEALDFGWSPSARHGRQLSERSWEGLRSDSHSRFRTGGRRGFSSRAWR